MASFLTNINLKQNELQNAVIQHLETAPSNPKNGQVYYDTTKGKFCVFENLESKYLSNSSAEKTEFPFLIFS